MKRTALITFALTVAAIAVAGQAGTWKRVVKKDETSVHKLVVKTDFQGTPIEFRAKSTATIKDVKDDGAYVVSEETSEVVLVMDGQEQDAGGGEGATVRQVDALGETKKIESATGDVDEYRFTNLTTFIFPKEAPAKGLKWSHKIAADTARNLVDTEFKYEILDKEAIGDADCWKVSFSMKEATGDFAAACSGTMWVSAKDGQTYKLDGKFENMPVQGMALTGTMTITRQ